MFALKVETLIKIITEKYIWQIKLFLKLFRKFHEFSKSKKLVPKGDFI